MNIGIKRNGKSTSGERKKFSFKDHGISSYHAAPAALMVVTGLVLSTLVSDVQPVFNQVFASSVEGQKQTGNSILEEITTQLSDSADAEDENLSYTALDYPPMMAEDLWELKSESETSAHEYDFSAHTSLVDDAAANEKLLLSEKEKMDRELLEAKGEPVASYNRNLYLDTYSYQRGPSNIPSTGAYTSCIPGTPISQMQMPESLTFDENGVPENYLYCIEGKATAYYGGSMTATGSPTRPGVVAVDPREIPYGTEMWIVSADGRYVYGFARAEDTGGFIYWENGATVDLYMNSYADCCVWGWRGVKIYILPTSYK